MSRVAVWSPLPPAVSGVADYVAETLPLLNERCDLQLVVADPEAVAPELRARFSVSGPSDVQADIDVYHLGNSPEHGYIYRAACARPGVVLLHDWNLHDLVLAETLERGAGDLYLREMRREHGALGSFAGRQIMRALGGRMLPALFPLNARILESSLGIIGLTARLASLARAIVPDRPVLHLPHHFALPLDPLPTRAAARHSLGLPSDAFVLTIPGLATANKRIDALFLAARDLDLARVDLRVVIAGQEDPAVPIGAWAESAGLGDRLVRTGRLALPDFVRYLVAADVVATLRFPSYGEISGALVRALGIGRPALVTAGTPAEEEFPPGTVVPVSPGVSERAELVALLRWLAGDAALRDGIGAQARRHVSQMHDLDRTVSGLWTFIVRVMDEKPRSSSVARACRVPDEGLLEFILDEVRWYARSLDVPVQPLVPLIADLLGTPC
jgi:glycosyltransferase involved in cell wall biosynthesis